jgi:hypothetical protein
MKIILIVVLIFFVSCSKQAPNNIISENEKSDQVLNNFRSLSSPADKRLAYNLLLSEEKYILWKNHVAEIVIKANFKQEQKNILEVITGKLSAKVF